MSNAKILKLRNCNAVAMKLTLKREKIAKINKN